MTHHFILLSLSLFLYPSLTLSLSLSLLYLPSISPFYHSFPLFFPYCLSLTFTPFKISPMPYAGGRRGRTGKILSLSTVYCMYYNYTVECYEKNVIVMYNRGSQTHKRSAVGGKTKHFCSHGQHRLLRMQSQIVHTTQTTCCFPLPLSLYHVSYSI